MIVSQSSESDFPTDSSQINGGVILESETVSASIDSDVVLDNYSKDLN